MPESTYSISPPIGRPRAIRDTLILLSFRSSAIYCAVVFPSVVKLVVSCERANAKQEGGKDAYGYVGGMVFGVRRRVNRNQQKRAATYLVWAGRRDLASGLDSNSSSLLPLLSSPASPVALLITIDKRTAEIGFALATKTSYNHSRAEHRLAKGDDVVDVIHSQS